LLAANPLWPGRAAAPGKSGQLLKGCPRAAEMTEQRTKSERISRKRSMRSASVRLTFWLMSSTRAPQAGENGST
jgi:hypothetical protein